MLGEPKRERAAFVTRITVTVPGLTKHATRWKEALAREVSASGTNLWQQLEMLDDNQLRVSIQGQVDPACVKTAIDQGLERGSKFIATRDAELERANELAREQHRRDQEELNRLAEQFRT